MLSIVISVCIALELYMVIVMLFGNSKKEKLRARLDKLAENVELEYVHDAVINEKKKNRKLRKKSKLISKQFEDSLAMSGIKINAREFFTIWVFLTLAPALVGVLLKLKTIAITGLCIVGFAIPLVWTRRSKNKTQQLFNKQLGESLTIMSNCMRSGYSFQQAMGSIAQEMQPPISTEFSRVVREMNYGTPMEQALNNMVARVDNKDLELLISAVVTSSQVGANLSEILDTIAETVSDRIKIREEVRVFSAQGRMSGIIIGVLPIVVILFLMILNPDYLSDFMANPLGKIMLGASVFLEVVGFIVINKIVDIKY